MPRYAEICQKKGRGALQMFYEEVNTFSMFVSPQEYILCFGEKHNVNITFVHNINSKKTGMWRKT